jgi:hypothetical protein
MNWNLINFILEELQKTDMPKFDDDEEKICWMLQETWKLAQQNGEIK